MALPPNQGLLPPPALAPAPAVPGGRGRGNRGRRGRGRTRTDDVNVRPPRQPQLQPPPAGPPRPQYLATTATPERNDPLWSTGVAGSELQPMPNVEYVYSGAEVLPTLTSVLHASCVSLSPGYSQRVPESALAYYCAVLTFARMLQLQAANSLEVSADEERFVEQVASLQLQAPLLLAHYLSGFGNTRVPSGRDVRFRMRNRPGYARTDAIRGWFGRVSPETQVLYQNYPCLAVYAARLQAELNIQAPRRWALPLAIQPVEAGGLGASSSLLGYAPKANISPGQVSFLEASELYHDEEFASVNPSLPLNISILISVQNELQRIEQLRLSALPTSVVGSQAQLGRIFYDDELVPLAARPAVFECPYQMPVEISFAASAFGYRIHHAIDYVGDEDVAPWVIWRYHPGDAWLPYVEAGNTLRGGEPDFLAISEYRTTPYLVRARLEALEAALTLRPP